MSIYANKAAEVLNKGQESKDNRNVSDYLLNSKVPMISVTANISFVLLTQIKRDAKIEYKFYDALSMWLGQWPNWSTADLDYLMAITNEYLST